VLCYGHNVVVMIALLAVQNENSNYRVVNFSLHSDLPQFSVVLLTYIDNRESARTMQLLILYLLVSDYR